MARKTTEYTVSAEGRDQGKRFLITEMPAAQAESWARRALSVANVSGPELLPEILGAGMSGVAMIGMRVLTGPHDMVQPLMDEMFSCIQIMEAAVTRKLQDNDIEEVATRLALRTEVLDLHLGFFKAVVSSIREAAVAAMARTTAITPTSPETLEPSSAPS